MHVAAAEDAHSFAGSPAGAVAVAAGSYARDYVGLDSAVDFEGSIELFERVEGYFAGAAVVAAAVTSGVTSAQGV